MMTVVPWQSQSRIPRNKIRKRRETGEREKRGWGRSEREREGGEGRRARFVLKMIHDKDCLPSREEVPSPEASAYEDAVH